MFLLIITLITALYYDSYQTHYIKTEELVEHTLCKGFFSNYFHNYFLKRRQMFIEKDKENNQKIINKNKKIRFGHFLKAFVIEFYDYLIDSIEMNKNKQILKFKRKIFDAISSHVKFDHIDFVDAQRKTSFTKLDFYDLIFSQAHLQCVFLELSVQFLEDIYDLETSILGKIIRIIQLSELKHQFFFQKLFAWLIYNEINMTSEEKRNSKSFLSTNLYVFKLEKILGIILYLNSQHCVNKNMFVDTFSFSLKKQLHFMIDFIKKRLIRFYQNPTVNKPCLIFHFDESLYKHLFIIFQDQINIIDFNLKEKLTLCFYMGKKFINTLVLIMAYFSDDNVDIYYQVKDVENLKEECSIGKSDKHYQEMHQLIVKMLKAKNLLFSQQYVRLFTSKNNRLNTSKKNNYKFGNKIDQKQEMQQNKNCVSFTAKNKVKSKKEDIAALCNKNYKNKLTKQMFFHTYMKLIVNSKRKSSFMLNCNEKEQHFNNTMQTILPKKILNTFQNNFIAQYDQKQTEVFAIVIIYQKEIILFFSDIFQITPLKIVCQIIYITLNDKIQIQAFIYDKKLIFIENDFVKLHHYETAHNILKYFKEVDEIEFKKYSEIYKTYFHNCELMSSIVKYGALLKDKVYNIVFIKSKKVVNNIVKVKDMIEEDYVKKYNLLKNKIILEQNQIRLDIKTIRLVFMHFVITLTYKET